MLTILIIVEEIEQILAMFHPHLQQMKLKTRTPLNLRFLKILPVARRQDHPGDQQSKVTIQQRHLLLPRILKFICKPHKILIRGKESLMITRNN